MSFRFIFVLVWAAALVFAQEAPAPSEAAAKVTLPPTPAGPPPPDTTAAQASPKPAPSADSPQAAPKPASDSPVVQTPKPTPAKAPSSKPEKTDASGHKPYIFGAHDVILIKIYNQPTLSGPVTVTTDGFISLPVAGDIKAEGLTREQLRDSLTQRLKECCFNNPEGEVDVELGKNESKRFYVIGGVGRPGQYPLDRDDMTVMEALSDVGGLHEFAKKKKIRIQRRGVPKEFLFNYIEVSKGRHMEQDIVIQNGDRIFVDE